MCSLAGLAVESWASLLGLGMGWRSQKTNVPFPGAKVRNRDRNATDTSVSNRHPQAAWGLFISPKMPMGQERFTAIDQTLRAERAACQRQLLGLRP